MGKDKISQEVFDLYDHYVHSKIDRRTFTEQLSQYAVGGLTVTAILEYLMPKIQLKAEDDRLNTEMIEYTSPQGAGTM